MDPSSTPLTQPTGPFHMAWYARPGLTSVTVLVFFFFSFSFCFFFSFYCLLRTSYSGTRYTGPGSHYNSIPFNIYRVHQERKRRDIWSTSRGIVSPLYLFFSLFLGHGSRRTHISYPLYRPSLSGLDVVVPSLSFSLDRPYDSHIPMDPCPLEHSLW